MNNKRSFLSKWRIFPKISYTNFKKEYSKIGDDCFTKWFSVQKYWGGRIIGFSIKHHVVSLDFRKNWLVDMVDY